MPADSWKLAPGLSHVGAYQVSGRPFASASIDGLDGARPGGHEIVFPYVTRWFKVINKDENNVCKVSFSVSGMTGSNNYFTVGKADLAGGHGMTDTGPLELKVSSIYIWFKNDFGENDHDVIEHFKKYANDTLKRELENNKNGISSHSYDWRINAP